MTAVSHSPAESSFLIFLRGLKAEYIRLGIFQAEISIRGGDMEEIKVNENDFVSAVQSAIGGNADLEKLFIKIFKKPEEKKCQLKK